MFTNALKRALPFTLTLIVGIAFGSLVNLFSKGTSVAPAPRFEPPTYHARGGCGKRRRSAIPPTPLNIISEPSKRYTKEAFKNKVTGVVRLRITYGSNGSILDVEPLTTLPYGLTEEAERVAWQINFEPATVNGLPVTVTQDQDYIFSLSDESRRTLD